MFFRHPQIDKATQGRQIINFKLTVTLMPYLTCFKIVNDMSKRGTQEKNLDRLGCKDSAIHIHIFSNIISISGQVNSNQ